MKTPKERKHCLILTIKSEKGERWTMNDITSVSPKLIIRWLVANKLPTETLMPMLTDLMANNDAPSAPGKSVSVSRNGWAVTMTLHRQK